MKQKGLGRGLGIFIDESVNLEPEGQGVTSVPIQKIDIYENQPRKFFDEEKLDELAASIKKHGVIQPLILKKQGSRYQIIAGERRYRAARLAGLKEVPAIFMDADEKETLEISIIENIQREDLNPIEEAEGLQALIDKCGFTQEEVAASVGKSRPAIANSLRLLKLPPEVRDMTKNGEISAGHARALLAFDNEAMIFEVAKNIVSNKLTVRDVERLAKIKEPSAPVQKRSKRRDSFYDEVELSLTEALGRKVKVYTGRGKGTIEIEFYSAEELKDIANKLGE